MRTIKWWLGGLVIAIVLALNGTGVFAQYDYSRPAAGGSLQDEFKTAVTHAGFAAKYDTLKEVTVHLHHVLNCLVGPKDSKMFDSAAGNPCQGQGNGILPDIQSNKDKYTEAWWAAHLADEAITMKNLDQAKSAGHIIMLVLTDVQK